MKQENGYDENILVEKTDTDEISSVALKTKTHNKRYGRIWLVVFPVLLLCSIVISCYIGMNRMKDAFEEADEEAYNNIYQVAFEKAEKANHVSNYALISIEDMHEIERLEVLEVQGSEFVIKNADEKNKITSWLEVKGTGIFTVDLSMGEFITDSERRYVLVRVPNPVLTNVKVTGTDTRFWKDDRIVSNGSVKEGVELSQNQMSEGRIKIEDSMRRSRRFNEESKNAARRILTALVQEWNPNIPELQVEVEFMD